MKPCQPFIKRKHPRKEKGEKKETSGKDQSPGHANSSKEAGHEEGKGTTKYLNLHQ